MKINELNQQVVQLQDENEKLQSLTTGTLHESCHDSDQEFHLSVEHQLQGHNDQSALLQEKVEKLKSELQEVKLTLEDERRTHKGKVLELDLQLSTSSNQVKQHTINQEIFM